VAATERAVVESLARYDEMRALDGEPVKVCDARISKGCQCQNRQARVMHSDWRARMMRR
jgi:hypothetical protein